MGTVLQMLSRKHHMAIVVYWLPLLNIKAVDETHLVLQHSQIVQGLADSLLYDKDLWL